VARLRPEHGFEALPPMRRLGEQDDAGLAREVGALLGRQLRAVGIDQDYAPVVDVDTNPANPVIGDRSLGRDPALVSRMGAALARGLQSAGVAACAKHFPGHGDTSQDSHVALPRLPHPRARLEAVELAPFRALSRAGVASVMTAHVIFEALDPDRPATLSPPVMKLLRESCGFDGAALSDDLEMAAVAAHFPLEVAVPGALAAGVDALLVCHRAEVAHRAIDLARAAVERGTVTKERLAEARRRVGALVGWAAPPQEPRSGLAALRRPEALALAARLPARAAGPDPTAA
jgi:beta-N-acetylhexosaminidase